MLAMRQAHLSIAIQESRNTTAQVSDDTQQQPSKSILSVLGPDLLAVILTRQRCVRSTLHFAETSRESNRLVYSNVIWTPFYARLLPVHPPDSSAPPTETLTAVLTAVELMLENPLLLVPLPDEEQAFRWYAGDRDRLSPSNVFLMLVASKIEPTHFAVNFDVHLKSMRTLFQADLMMKCFLEATEGIRSAVESEPLALILLAVRSIGNRLNNSRTVAFGLSSLRLLRGVQCNSTHKGTLLHYLAAFLMRRAPDALTILDHLGNLEAASRALQRIEVTLPRFKHTWKDADIVMAPASDASDPQKLLMEEAIQLRSAFHEVLLPVCYQFNKYFGVGALADTRERKAQRLQNGLGSIVDREEDEMAALKSSNDALKILSEFISDLARTVRSTSDEIRLAISIDPPQRENMLLSAQYGLGNIQELQADVRQESPPVPPHSVQSSGNNSTVPPPPPPMPPCDMRAKRPQSASRGLREGESPLSLAHPSGVPLRKFRWIPLENNLIASARPELTAGLGQHNGGWGARNGAGKGNRIGRGNRESPSDVWWHHTVPLGLEADEESLQILFALTTGENADDSWQGAGGAGAAKFGSSVPSMFPLPALEMFVSTFHQSTRHGRSHRETPVHLEEAVSPSSSLYSSNKEPETCAQENATTEKNRQTAKSGASIVETEMDRLKLLMFSPNGITDESDLVVLDHLLQCLLPTVSRLIDLTGSVSAPDSRSQNHGDSAQRNSTYMDIHENSAPGGFPCPPHGITAKALAGPRMVAHLTASRSNLAKLFAGELLQHVEVQVTLGNREKARRILAHSERLCLHAELPPNLKRASTLLRTHLEIAQSSTSGWGAAVADSRQQKTADRFVDFLCDIAMEVRV